MTPVPLKNVLWTAFVTNAALLVFEFGFLRLLSFTFWSHMVYVILTLALIGMTFGYALQVLWPGSSPEHGANRVVHAIAGFSLFQTLALAGVVFLPMPFSYVVAGSSLGWLMTVLVILLSLPPFTIAGYLLAWCWSALPQEAPRLTAVGLAGSVAGIALFWFGFEPLQAMAFFPLCALLPLAVLPALSSVGAQPSAAKGNIALAAAAILAGLTIPLWFAPVSDFEKSLEICLKDGWKTEYTRWTKTARFDVVATTTPTGATVRKVTVDGDSVTDLAGPAIAPVAADVALYLQRPGGKALVIGSGGGPDVKSLRQGKVSEIDAVELQPGMVEIVTRAFPDHLDNLFSQPGVRLINREGRGFLPTATDRYDFLVMTGVDTFAALSNGAYLLSEAYLYTREALMGYLRVLKPSGILRMKRWAFPIPRETLRLCTVCISAMRSLGIEKPWQHISIMGESDWATLLASPSPLDQRLLDQVWQQFLTASPSWCLAFAADGTPIRRGPVPAAYIDCIGAEREKREEAYFAAYPFNIRPVSDDQPFFFQYYRFDRLWDDLSRFRGAFTEQFDRGNQGTLIRELIQGLWPLLVIVLLLSASLLAWIVLLGLFLTCEGKGASRGRIAPFAYFTLTGLGFMTVEMLGIQRSVLLLAHPAEAMMVNTLALLAGAGVGGIFLAAIPGREAVAARAGILTGILALALIAFLPSETWMALGRLPIHPRLAVFLLFFVLGIGIGLPTPAGLTRSGRAGENPVWFVAANQAGSVVGSMLPVFLSLLFGFSTTAILAGVLYLLALLLTAGWGDESGH